MAAPICMVLLLDIATISFFVFSLNPHYKTEECAFNMKAWMIVTFVNFNLNVILFLVTLIMNAKIRYYVNLFIMFILIPFTFIFNLIGNFALPRLDKNSPGGPKCVYDGWFEGFIIGYLILIYIEVLLFALLAKAIYSLMKRYFNAVDPGRQGRNLFRRRTCLEYEFAFDFAFYTLLMSSSSSRQMSQFITPHIQEQKSQLIMQSLKVLVYKAPDRSDSPLIIQESQQKQVSGFHKSFAKYTECTICLNNFENEQQVIVIPTCEHLFHEKCLKQWIQIKLRCPNCNTNLEPNYNMQRQLEE